MLVHFTSEGQKNISSWKKGVHVFILLLLLFQHSEDSTILVLAGLFCHFHNLSNPDMDFRIFNVSHFSACVYTCIGDLVLSHPKDFCKVCTEFDPEEISGQVQNLTRQSPINVTMFSCA